jgi:hypothetical protein
MVSDKLQFIDDTQAVESLIDKLKFAGQAPLQL